MTPENKFTPRVWIDKSRSEPGAHTLGIATLEKLVDTDEIYLSLEEHNHLLREAIAKTWEEAARMCRFYSPGDNLHTVFDSKAKKARDK